MRGLPVPGWLGRYRRDWLGADLLAGVTAAAVVIPQAMGYATIVGLPVEIGLYTALVPTIVYALLGTARPLSVSTTSTIAILTATAIAETVPGGDSVAELAAVSTLALLVGLLLVLAGILRLGFLANFVSLPVLTGFKAGIGLVILVGQLGKLIGVPIPRGGLFETILRVLASLGEIHWLSFLLAAATLGLLLGLPKRWPTLPAALVAVTVGIGASALFGLGQLGVKSIGQIPPGLPSAVLPDLALVGSLWPAALGIALMAFTESIAAARAFTRRGDAKLDANRELLALGLANLAGSLFRTLPAGGGTSQTAVNDRSGARSQLAGAVTAGVVVVTLLILAPLISLMPQATLGAVVLVSASGLIKPKDFRAIGQIRRVELSWALTALVGVALLGTLRGILVAVVLSLLSLIYEANRPRVYALGRKRGTDVFRPLPDHPDDETFPGLLIVRAEGRIYFANAARVGEQVWPLIAASQPRVVVLDCSAIPDIEYTALMMLTEAEAKLRDEGGSLWLAALNPEVLRVIERAQLGRTPGGARLFDSVQEAVEAFLEVGGEPPQGSSERQG